MYYQSFALTGNLPGREVPGGQGIRMPGRDGRTFCLSPQVHTLFLGATGFGKTTALLRMVPALRQEVTRRGGVLFFFDPKEDFIAALARYSSGPWKFRASFLPNGCSRGPRGSSISPRPPARCWPACSPPRPWMGFPTRPLPGS